MTATGFHAAVDLAVDTATAYGFLADPRQRPRWQSSLRSVSLIQDGAPRVGLTWVDNTVTGVRPQMTITAMDPGRLWAERGTWAGIEGRLTLRFEETLLGCRILADGLVLGSGPWALPAALAGRLGGPAVAADLRRAEATLREMTDQ